MEEKSGREQAHGASVITSAMACAACSSARRKASPLDVPRGAALRGASPAGGTLTHEIGDPQEIVRQDRRPHEHLEPLAPLKQAATHPAAAEEDRDAAFHARAEALPLLEAPTLLVRGALFGLLAAPLGDTLGAHAGGGQRLDIVRRVEPAVGRVEVGDASEGGFMLAQRRRDVHLVDGIAVEDPVVGDEAEGALRQEDLWAGLDQALPRA